MGFSPDHIPVVGEVPDLPGAWFLAGFTGHGMSIGFRLSQLVVEAMTTSARPGDLDLFDLRRLSSRSAGT